MYIAETVIKYKFSFSHDSKFPSFVSNFKVGIKCLTERHRTTNNTKQKKGKISDSEINLKLKKYNQELNRYIKTLSYISIMEVKYENKDDFEQLKKLFCLKEKIQREVIRTTKKITHFKLIKNSKTNTLV